MGDWFAAAQSQYDHAVPSYLEADDRPCDECGVPGEDHCDECGGCECVGACLENDEEEED
jgi:hypothetical protein